MLGLLRELRTRSAGHYLLANRGFSLFPELAPLVDGLLFECFSSTWQGGYRALSAPDLHYTAGVLQRVTQPSRGRGRPTLDLYALDYAVSEELATFSRSRAERYGLTPLISNRDLTRL